MSPPRLRLQKGFTIEYPQGRRFTDSLYGVFSSGLQEALSTPDLRGQNALAFSCDVSQGWLLTEF